MPKDYQLQRAHPVNPERPVQQQFQICSQVQCAISVEADLAITKLQGSAQATGSYETVAKELIA